MQAKTIPINVAQLRHACSSCSLNELCLPAGLDLQEIDRLDTIVNRKRALKRGDYLYDAPSSIFNDLQAAGSRSNLVGRWGMRTEVGGPRHG